MLMKCEGSSAIGSLPSVVFVTLKNDNDLQHIGYRNILATDVRASAIYNERLAASGEENGGIPYAAIWRLWLTMT
jgi:hypothetical protein